jgi:hypothetical protein
MNMDVQVSLLYIGLPSFVYMFKSGIAGSHAKFYFQFFEEFLYCTSFPHGCTNLHSHNREWGLLSPYILVNDCLCLFSSWLTFWMEWDGISMLFWLSLPLRLRKLNMFSYIYWPFVHLSGTDYSIHLPIHWSNFLFFWHLFFFKFFIYSGY